MTQADSPWEQKWQPDSKCRWGKCYQQHRWETEGSSHPCSSDQHCKGSMGPQDQRNCRHIQVGKEGTLWHSRLSVSGGTTLLDKGWAPRCQLGSNDQEDKGHHKASQ